MGGNEYVATTKYTVTFKNAEGSVISSAEYDEGAAVTVPELPATTKDDTNHYTYSWDVEPSLTAVANATYQVVKTGAAHIWGEGVVTKEPTATEEVQQGSAQGTAGSRERRSRRVRRGEDESPPFFSRGRRSSLGHFRTLKY